MSPSLGSNLGWILPYLSLVSQVSLIKSVFGGTQMMLGTNSQSVMPPMSVKIVLDNLLQCVLSYIHTSSIYVVWWRRVSVEVLVNLCSISQGKKRGTAPCTRPRRASGTPCPTTLQIAVNKSKEREELRWSLNTTCCSILYLCLLYLRIGVQSCYDVIVLFTLVINCFK